MRGFGRHALRALLVAPLLLASADAQMCKWVDEYGAVHYAEACPEGVGAERVEIDERAAPGPPAKTPQSPFVGRDPDADARTLSLQRLGPRPALTSSRYLRTTSAEVRPDDISLGAQFIIRLMAADRLPKGALLEARFPDPSRPGQASHERFVYEGLSPIIRLASRPAKRFHCWNYHVFVSVYRDETRAELLDTHEQVVQSRYDLSGIRDQDDFAEATSGASNCPGSRSAALRSATPPPDYSAMTARQLDAECERAREELLKPERQALIRRCKSMEGKDPDWCERYYRDYGAARRQGNVMLPPKYSDLPVCVAAREARRRGD